MQGAVEIASWLETTDGWATVSRALTAPQSPYTTDSSNLFVELIARGGDLRIDLNFTEMADEVLDPIGDVHACVSSDEDRCGGHGDVCTKQPTLAF